MPAVSDVIKLQLHHSMAQDTNVTNVFHFKYSGGAPADSDMTTFCTDVKSAWVTDLAAYLQAGRSLVEVTAVDLSSSTAAAGVWTGSVAGTRSGSVLPDGCAALVNYQIQRRYRGGKPRSYFPYLVEGDLATAQQWSPTPITDLQEAVQTWITAVLALGVGPATLTQWVSVSYYEGFTPFTTPSGRVKNLSTLRTVPVVDAITSAVGNPIVGSQRKRYQRS